MLFPWTVVALLAELPAAAFDVPAGAAEDDPGAGGATAGAADVRPTLLT
jgi:hypothetical protein